MQSPTNLKRAEKAAALLDHYEDDSSREECLSDLLGDLRHYADCYGLDFAERDGVAHRNYQAEIDEGGSRSSRTDVDPSSLAGKAEGILATAPPYSDAELDEIRQGTSSPGTLSAAEMAEECGYKVSPEDGEDGLDERSVDALIAYKNECEGRMIAMIDEREKHIARFLDESRHEFSGQDVADILRSV